MITCYSNGIFINHYILFYIQFYLHQDLLPTHTYTTPHPPTSPYSSLRIHSYTTSGLLRCSKSVPCRAQQARHHMTKLNPPRSIVTILLLLKYNVGRSNFCLTIFFFKSWECPQIKWLLQFKFLDFVVLHFVVFSTKTCLLLLATCHL